MRLWFDVQALQGPFFERGIQRYVRAVATELEQRGAPVEGFGLNPSQRAPYSEHGLVSRSALLRPATAAALRDAAAAHPDLVYLCGSAFEGFTPIQNLWPNTLVAPRLPVSSIVYDTIPFRRPAEFQATAERRSFYGARRLLLRHADQFLAISESTARELVEDLEVDPGGVHVIGCGVDARFVPAADPEAVRARLLTDLPALRFPFLLYVGGFQPQKNVEGLLEAYARLDPALRGEHQLVVGGNVPPPLRQAWGERTVELGIADQVVFTGLVDDDTLVRLYQATRLMVFPSLHEGFGLPVAEAAACGAPALSSDTSSLPEVIGWAPATFDPTDPDSIAAAIERALTDEAFATALRAACAGAPTRHRWERVVDRLLEATARLADAGAGRSAPLAPKRLAVVGSTVKSTLAHLVDLRRDYPGWSVDVFAGAGRTDPSQRIVHPLRSFVRTAEPELYDHVVVLPGTDVPTRIGVGAAG